MFLPIENITTENGYYSSGFNNKFVVIIIYLYIIVTTQQFINTINTIKT